MRSSCFKAVFGYRLQLYCDVFSQRFKCCLIIAGKDTDGLFFILYLVRCKKRKRVFEYVDRFLSGNLRCSVKGIPFRQGRQMYGGNDPRRYGSADKHRIALPLKGKIGNKLFYHIKLPVKFLLFENFGDISKVGSYLRNFFAVSITVSITYCTSSSLISGQNGRLMLCA